MKMLRDAAIITGITVVLFALLGESGLRLLDRLRIPVLAEGVEPDPRFGWRAKRNLQFSGPRKDFDGATREVHFHTDSNGFRMFGDVQSSRCKVLFLGDSFTLAKDVSDGEPYFARLADNDQFEVFAYGCDGYSTLQQLFLLEDWVDEIEPNVMVLQLCHNDFIGNLPELTRCSALNQCQIAQPFLMDDGDIAYVNPADGSWSQAMAWTHSRLINFVTRRVDNRKGLPTFENSIEHQIEKTGTSHLLFQRSRAITESLAQKLIDGCKGRKLIVFCVDNKQPYFDTFREVFAKSDAVFVGELPQKIQAAHEGGASVFAADGAHWNPAGHALAADALLPELTRACATAQATLRH